MTFDSVLVIVSIIVVIAPLMLGSEAESILDINKKDIAVNPEKEEAE